MVSFRMAFSVVDSDTGASKSSRNTDLVVHYRRNPNLIERIRFLTKCVSVVLFLISASAPLSVSLMSVETPAESGVDPLPAEETIRCEPVRIGRGHHRPVRIDGRERHRLAEVCTGIGKFVGGRDDRHSFLRSFRGHRWINGDRAPLRI